MALTASVATRRTGLFALVCFVFIVCGLYVPLLPTPGLKAKKAGRGGATYIYEMDTHDGESLYGDVADDVEVIGAIGVSVSKAGYEPWFACT
jgi:hypothetical protein